MTDLVNTQRLTKYESPRLVTYYGKYDTLSIDIEEGQFIDLIVLDGDELIAPRVMKVGSKVFKCNKILVKQHNYIHGLIELSLYYTILNKTSNYLLPTLFTPDESRVGKKALLYETHFVNSFITMDDKAPNYSIYLLYRYDGSANMSNLESWFKERDVYLNTYQPDKYHTIYEFEVKDKQAYDTFLSSKFAQFNERHKEKVKNFFSLKSEDFKYQVLTHAKKLKDKRESELVVTIPTEVSLNEAIKMEEETYKTEEMKVVYTLLEEEE